MWIVICDMGSISYNWQYGTSLNFVLIFTASIQWGKIVYDVEFVASSYKQFHEFLSTFVNISNLSISDWKILNIHILKCNFKRFWSFCAKTKLWTLSIISGNLWKKYWCTMKLIWIPLPRDVSGGQRDKKTLKYYKYVLYSIW